MVYAEKTLSLSCTYLLDQTQQLVDCRLPCIMQAVGAYTFSVRLNTTCP